MATWYLSPYRRYKFICTANYEQWIVDNLAMNTGWGFQDGLFWSDRNEPEYRLTKWVTTHKSDGAWTKIYYSNYELDSDGTPFLINTGDYSTKLSSGDISFEFVPNYVGGGNAPTIDSDLYGYAITCYDIEFIGFDTDNYLSLFEVTDIPLAHDTSSLYLLGSAIQFKMQIGSGYKINQINNVCFVLTYTDMVMGGTHSVRLSKATYGSFVSITYLGTHYLVGLTLNGLQDAENNYRNVCGVVSVELDWNGELYKSANSFSLVGEHITSSNPNTTPQSLQSYTTTLGADTGYTLDDSSVKVYMSGTDITASAYNTSTHVVSISNVTGDIVVSGSAIKNTTVVIKSYDGLTTYYFNTFTTAISTLTINVSGSTVYYVIDGTTVESHTLESVTGKVFAGLSSSALATTRTIAISTPYTIRGNITLYECFLTPDALLSTLDLYLYTTDSSVDDLDKILTSVGSLSGALREESDILYPVIKIEYSQINFNYVYIPIWKRYYFVTGIKSIRTGLWEITLKVDVLTTYKNLIRQQTAFVLRNEYVYDEDKVDTYVNTSYDKTINYQTINTSVDLFKTNYPDAIYNVVFVIVGIIGL